MCSIACENKNYLFGRICTIVRLVNVTLSKTEMKSPSIENIVVDEAKKLTYIVMAQKILTDGEIYRAIRVEILKRGGKLPARGETLVITLPKEA